MILGTVIVCLGFVATIGGQQAAPKTQTAAPTTAAPTTSPVRSRWTRTSAAGTPIAATRALPALYERHGFVAEEFTDGHGNEERTPDIRFRWTP